MENCSWYDFYKPTERLSQGLMTCSLENLLRVTLYVYVKVLLHVMSKMKDYIRRLKYARLKIFVAE